MARTRIKICGITRVEDALAAERAGCDAVGFVFWEESTRFVTLPRAREICRVLSPLVAKVGVFVSPALEDVSRAIQEVDLDAAQLCGPLPDADWSRISSRLRLIRALGVENDRPIAFDEVAGVNDYLFDTRDERTHGGTGRTFDWSKLRRRIIDRRVWLAGGLNSSNVAEAISIVRPFAVDVSSGVETEPGVKSAERIETFVAAVRAADASAGNGIR